DWSSDVCSADLQKQVRRRAEVVVGIGEQARIDVTVRADQRQVARAAIELPRDLDLARIRPETAILVEHRTHFPLPQSRAACNNASIFSGGVPGATPPPNDRINPPPGAPRSSTS